MHETTYIRPLPDKNIQALLLTVGVLLTALVAGIYLNVYSAIAIGLVAIVIPYWRLDRALIVFLAATLLWPQTMAWQVGPLLWGPSRVMFLILILTWVFAWSKGQVSLRSTPIDVPLLIFSAVLLVSEATTSLGMTPEQFSRSIKLLGFTLVEWIALFYIVTSIAINNKIIKRIIVIIITIVSIVALIGVIEYLTGVRIFEWLRLYLPGGANMRSNLHEYLLQNKLWAFYRGGIVRIVSTTISPHEVGVLMTMTLPLVLYFLAYASNWRHTLLSLIALGLMISALFLSVTRGAMLAAILVILCQSIFSKKGLLRAAFILTTAFVLISITLFPTLSDALSAVARPGEVSGETSISTRAEDWPEAFKLIEGRELFGLGPGLVSGQKLVGYGTAVSESFKSTDNFYLSTFAETGIFGLLSLFIVLSSIVVLMIKGGGKKRSAGGDEIYDLKIAILSSLIGFMFMSFTFSAFNFITVTKFFWVIVGLGMGLVIATEKGNETY